ncbi:methyltransferase domain-containing protein [Nocardioides sp. Kera G14]|uniref:methyltransferase domain-containing protein n=1 Tax=Nocardioides sp. Kera G14 TaxID=2884264 RepID=UPI001D10F0B9|nr:methyltransferase domain-containing protein [Nocardioides sp. Kera G14]UDY24988.1 methyltransferase domain-containing protein [Nocardioides sp. Kera G14]
MPTTSYGPLTIAYDGSVLAPRAWTIEQSEWGASLWDRTPRGPVLELCSGVGHIGLALALRTSAELVMVDSSADACDYARKNAADAGLSERVEVRCGDLETSLAPDERFDVILADPPWVPSDSVAGFAEDPEHAIDGGPDGLALVRTCLDLIAAHLSPEGHAVLQVGPGQSDDLAHPGLVVLETRWFGDRGELVHIQRE